MQKKTVAAIAAGTVLTLGFGSVGLNEALAKTVTVSLDGTPTELRTYAGTVDQVLAANDITLGEHDVVAPSGDSRLTEGTQISVQYARPVTVTIDGQERSLWTTATSVEQVLSMLQLTDEKTVVSTSRSAGIGREGLSFSVTTPKDVTLNVDDESEQLVSTVRTVEELLKEHGVTLEEGDTVEPGLETELSSGLQVAVTRAPEPEPEPEPEPKPEPKKTESTSTKASAEPKASSTPKASSAPKESAAASSNSSVWDALAQCESGGNWSINSGNGYYGGLQFSLQTWRAYGGTGMPHEASKAEQIAVAEKIKAGQGWGAWPACSSKLGLR